MSYRLTPEQEALVAHWSEHNAMRFAQDAFAETCPSALRGGNGKRYFLTLSERRRALLIAEALDAQAAEASPQAPVRKPARAVAVVACAGGCGTWLPAPSTWRPVVRFCCNC